MLTEVSYDDFVRAQGTAFVLSDTDPEISLALVEVGERRLRGKYESFSLVFTSGKEHFLPQKIYSLKHQSLGEGGLFLVPVEEKEDGFLYQAVFNRETGGNDQ